MGEERVKKRKKRERPVISVRNVSMFFRVPVENTSSLKEFVISMATGRNRYRTLRALNGIRFDVYKGEIVGIIGIVIRDRCGGAYDVGPVADADAGEGPVGTFQVLGPCHCILD